MNLIDMYCLEVEGISETIRSYAIDRYIKSYSKQLVGLDVVRDYEKIKVIVSRLINWYSNNLDHINKSNFVANKKEHQKSYELLIELRDRLNLYKAG